MIGRILASTLAAAALTGCQGGDEGGNAAASANGVAGGRAETTIAQTVGQTAELARFNEAVRAAGLAETFAGAGPYTIFAPVDAAFDALPAEARTRLMAAEGREELTQLLTYHVVAGVVTSQDLAAAMERGQGRAVLGTIAGQNLIVTREGDGLVITDGAGGKARIGQPDRRQSNGIVHQIDAVLMPGAGSGEQAAGGNSQ